ncbi:hypothetical protein GQ43DRAFT_20103 [Delitschia confertaspora ATCC 74209]|uniref:Dynactin subunit 4 n=1 Tax=Delitschia confertaspora ATCC 74209 TaxID=1513339 RepID=A0A9P4MZF6_9PLEO|nr:hypothetical protein GQ43DRAFT_20103 [Delitschia confertaspora ATCC 74209]
MAQPFPYTYYVCDCYDSKTKVSAKRSSQPPPADDEDERTFDPRNPRSNYSLYPLEHLLYCEDCQQIRCSRCVIEETLNWYCPSCLFEVPSSLVKSEGNRCARNCYNCPVCISPMTVNELPKDPSEDDGNGPFYLYCNYCHWSTIEIGIEFERHTQITHQLQRIANGGKPIPTPKEREKERERRRESEWKRKDDIPEINVSHDVDPEPSPDDTFAALASFYKGQIQASTTSSPFSPHDLDFSSPSSFSRIMNMYTSTSSKKTKREKPTPMREAASTFEGLTLHDSTTDSDAIDRIRREGWSITLSPAQKHAQPNPNIRFTSELRPIATLLRTKRGKRCRNCRHILSKPEAKITSTRYKIKLLALNHIPKLHLRALPPPASTPQPTFGSSILTPLPIQPPFDYDHLKPGIPTHFLLTLTNPLFDPIRVTLATPSTTPGKVHSRVTILCPQFEIGANTDVWDDAMSSTITPIRRGSVVGPDGQIQSGIEAGKVWDKGRNWTSIVMEVLPGFLDERQRPSDLSSSFSSDRGGVAENDGHLGWVDDEDEELGVDDDVLEIPIFVRLEFESDAMGEERVVGEDRGKGDKVKREEAFWSVVGVGRIAG